LKFEEAEAHHYYELLWCDDLWKKLVDETNRYAEQERRKPEHHFAAVAENFENDIIVIKTVISLLLFN
jgi:hypothetical protein